jgi:predicted RNA methylase
MTAAPRPPKNLVTAVRAALDLRVDVLANAYEHAVSAPHRRKLGTYFTPPEVVDFLLDEAQIVLASPPSDVVDPGAGVGAFTIGARRRWPTCTVTAVDLNPVTLGLLAARAADCDVKGVALVLDDYLSWLPSADGSSGPRLFLGNPPYTRYRDLHPDLRASAKRAAGSLVPNGMPGLSHYFLAATLRVLRSTDAIVFLLPGAWVEARYGRPVVEWFWHETRRLVRFSWFPHTTALFPDAVVNAMVVAVGPVCRAPAHPLLSQEVSLDSRAVVVHRNQSFVRQGEPPVRFDPWLWPAVEVAKSPLVPLGSFAKIRRGIATGDNAYFFLTDDEAAQLPPEALRPALLRLRDCHSDVLNQGVHDEIGADGKRRWVLWLHDANVVYDPRVQAYIRKGEEEGVETGHIASKRRVWYAVEKIRAPHLLISPMSQGRFRVVRNDICALPSNAMYGIYLPVEDEIATMLLHRHLNGSDGQARLLATTRRYGNGLFKIEPRGLGRALVLYLRAFDLQPSLLPQADAMTNP